MNNRETVLHEHERESPRNTLCMKRILGFLILLVFVSGLSGCNKAKRELERGNYERAVHLSIDKLRSKPKNKSAREVLGKGYDYAVAYHMENISMLTASRDPFKWEGMAASYDFLNRMHEDIRRCPACMDVVPQTRPYIDEGNSARERAAEVRYEKGLELLDQNDRNTAREAYQHFAVAEQLVPNFRDTRGQMIRALSEATLHVVVDQVPVNSRNFSLSGEFFQNQIHSYLATNQRLNDFVRFYTPAEAELEGIDQPDHIILLQFDDFMVGQIHSSSNSSTVTSKDSVKIGQATLPDGSKIDVYDKVNAKLTIHEKYVSSRGLLDMQIFDAWGDRILYHDKMPGEFIWRSTWGNFNGDERALTDEQKQITGRREIPPPPAQDLFIEFTKPIYGQVTDRIRRFYADF
jgi:hypothetical protein